MVSINNKYDVIMCTWNSNKPWFRRCLYSIKREIPICHFIVIDRYSTDDTQKRIREIFPNARIIESNSDLAKARAKAISYVDTEWFIFVDDDIELFKGWYENIIKYLDNKVGAVAFVALPEINWLKKFAYNSSKITKELKRNWESDRGIYCSNTFVKTSLVRDWYPPSFLSSGEDAHLSRHIITKGYKTILLWDNYVIHWGIYGFKNAKKKLWHYSGIRLIKYPPMTTKKLIRKFLTSPLKGIYMGIRLKESMIIPYVILSDFYSLKGWLKWNNYRVWQR